MPEFIPQYTPKNVNAFVRGYLDCAEWLLSEEDKERAELNILDGWHDSAIERATADCAAFEESNAADLESYLAEHDDYRAGMDLWLSRNGHGAGFFDRGNGPTFTRLQDAARGLGECDAYVGDDDSLYL